MSVFPLIKCYTLIFQLGKECLEHFFLVLNYHILQRDLTPPFVDDGLLEVVGFKDGWHGLVLLAPGGHGTRLAQVSGSQQLISDSFSSNQHHA